MRRKLHYPLNKEYKDLGLTNLHYETVNNQIIRVSRFKKELFLDRDNEVLVLNLIKTKTPSFALKIKDFGWQNDLFCVVTDYIPGLKSLLTTGISRVSITRLADTVKKFHSLEFDLDQYPIKKFDFKAFYYKIKNQIINFPFPYNYETEQEILDAVANLGTRP